MNEAQNTIEARRIFQRLRNTTRRLLDIGYCLPRLRFSGGSWVTMTNPEPSPLTAVEAILRQGERPLGFIARWQDFGEPLVLPWESGDVDAREELLSSAHQRYSHRLKPATIDYDE